LLKIARKSVESAVRDHKQYEYSPAGFEALAQERGAFVTLKEHGELRGCIGYVAPVKPLCITVRDVAVFAALRDTRFQPVSARELGALEYEISVLSPLRRVLDVKEIRVGQHGLIMKKGDIEGLLLPQVPVEEKWDRATFLEQTCYKAGLPKNCWQDADTDIFRFTALVFPTPNEPPLPPAPGSPSPPERPF
jgi:AmmeMemoRadiSam system protein A